MCNLRVSSARHGLTLVELLVVIAILVILVSVTIPLVRSISDDQPIDEAGSVLKSQLEAAQTRAIARGREVSVILVRDRTGVPNDATYSSLDAQTKLVVNSTLNTVYQLAIAESPPPFTGIDVTTSACEVRLEAPVDPQSPPSSGLATFPFTFVQMQRLGIQPGDSIRFNYQGREYSIVDIKANVNGAKTDVRFRPAPLFIKDPNVIPPPLAYQVFRAPRRTADPPINLPPGSFIDLDPQEDPKVVNPGLMTAATDETQPNFHPFASESGTAPSMVEDVQFVFGPDGRLHRMRGLSGAASRKLIVGGQNPGILLDELRYMPVPMMFPVGLAIRGGTGQAPRLDSVDVFTISPASAATNVTRVLNPLSSGSGQLAALSSLPRDCDDESLSYHSK